MKKAWVRRNIIIKVVFYWEESRIYFILSEFLNHVFFLTWFLTTSNMNMAYFVNLSTVFSQRKVTVFNQTWAFSYCNCVIMAFQQPNGSQNIDYQRTMDYSHWASFPTRPNPFSMCSPQGVVPKTPPSCAVSPWKPEHPFPTGRFSFCVLFVVVVVEFCIHFIIECHVFWQKILGDHKYVFWLKGSVNLDKHVTCPSRLQTQRVICLTC